MANITPHDAITWLSGSNRGLGGEMANIQIAQYGMREFPPDSQAYQAHEQVILPSTRTGDGEQSC